MAKFNRMGKETIEKNKMCWVEDCNEKFKEWPYCEKHRRMSERGHDLKVKVAGVKGFDNTPGKY